MSLQQNPNQQFVYWKKLQVNSSISNPAWKRIIRIFANLFMVSMTIIFFWGFVTILFEPNVVSKTLPTGNGDEQKYISGVFFQINAGLEKSVDGYDKRHIIFFENNKFYEYRYFPVENFSEMWNTAKSPAYVIFVLPVAWLVAKFSQMFGWNEDLIQSQASSNLFALLGAVLLMTVLIKLTTLHTTLSQRRNKKKLDRIKEETNVIKEKYGKNQGFSAKQKERAEIGALYRKNKINPVSSSLQGFVFAPLLLTMYLVVRYSLVVKVSGTADFALNGSIYEEIGQQLTHPEKYWRYIILIVIYSVITFGDLIFEYLFLQKKKIKPTTEVAKKNQQRQKIIKWVFLGFFFWLFFTIPVGTSIYWVYNGFLDKTQKVFFYNHDKRKLRRSSSYKAKLA